MILKDIFDIEKPIIGTVHLLPLPGSPRATSLDEIIERAIRDAKAYEEGGIDGIILENFGDAPYQVGPVGPETIASMTVAAVRVSENVSIPVGVNVLRNDAKAALAIAYACGGKFIRVNVHIGVYATDQGIIEGKAYETLILRKNLNADVAIFADVHVKHAYPLWNLDIKDAARDTVHRGLADAIIVTGRRTGEPPNIEDVLGVKEVVNEIPVFVGSGIDIKNVGTYLKVADGVIVGTSLKIKGKTENPVDLERVKRLVKEVNNYR